MLREHQQMKAVMVENNTALSYVYTTMVPDTVSLLTVIIRDQRNQMNMMCNNLSYALENPHAVDLIAMTYANARSMLAAYLEVCHRQGVHARYMEELYDRIGHDFDDDETIHKLFYTVLKRRRYPVTLYYFDKELMKKHMRY